MQNSAWIALLRHIPPAQQDQFMLVTASGIEIAIQSLLLIEQECVAIKGRLAGTQDAGRVFFIPYAQIDHLGFQKPIKDAEFTEIFGTLSLPSSAPPPPAPPPTTETNGHVQKLAPEEAPPTPAGTEPASAGPRPVIRSEVLERFRSRPGGPASSLTLPSPPTAQP
jgi:hypothetical protein